MIALGYVRRSKKSDEKTVSIEAQREKISAYCAGAGIFLAHVVEHDGVSGTKRKRFDVLEEAITVYEPQMLVIYQLDRLARDVAGLIDYLRSLARRSISVVESSGAAVDLSDPAGFLNTGVQGLFAEFYPLLIGQKTADALRHRRLEGRRYSNIAPLGYRYVGGRMEADPEEQRGLKILAECRRAGMGARRALRELQAAGYSGRSSLKAIHQALRRD